MLRRDNNFHWRAKSCVGLKSSCPLGPASRWRLVGGFFMSDEKEEYSLMDWIGTVIGIVVAGFIIFILIWPLIDPTPDKSSTLKENIQKATGK